MNPPSSLSRPTSHTAYDYCLLGNRALKDNNPNQAATYYGQMLALDSTFPFDRYALAQAFLEIKDYECAIVHFNLVLLRERKNPDAYYGRAHAYHALLDYQKALLDYEKALLYYKKSFRLDKERAIVFYPLAGVYAALHRHDEAIEMFNQCIEKKSYDLALVFYGRAKVYVAKKNGDLALADLLQSISFAPDNPNILYMLAEVNLSNNKFEQAIKYCNEALCVSRGKGDAFSRNMWHALSLAYFNLERYQESAIAAVKALLFDPKSPDLLRFCAKVYYFLDKPDMTFNYLEQAMGFICFSFDSYAGFNVNSSVEALFAACQHVSKLSLALSGLLSDTLELAQVPDLSDSVAKSKEQMMRLYKKAWVIFLHLASVCEHNRHINEAMSLLIEAKKLFVSLNHIPNLNLTTAEKKDLNKCCVNILLRVGSLYAQLEQYDNSISSYEEALIYLDLFKNEEQHKQYVAVLAQMMRVYLTLSDYDQIDDRAEQALELEPHNIDILYILGCSFEKRMQYSDAIIYFSTLIKLAPENADVMYRLAVCLFKQNKAEDRSQSLLLYRGAINLKLSQVELNEPNQLLYSMYLDYGAALLTLTQYESARAQFEQALLHNTTWEAYDGLAAACYALRDYPNAIEYYKLMIGKGQKSLEAYERISEMLSLLRKEEECNPYDIGAINLQSKNRDILYRYALFRFKQGLPRDLAKSISFFKVILSLHSRDIGAAYHCGLAFFRLSEQGNKNAHLEQSIAYFNGVILLNPHHEEALFHLGLAWLRSEKREQAIEYLTTLIGLNSNHGLAFLHRAQAYAYQKHFDEALADYNKAYLIFQKALELLEEKGCSIFDIRFMKSRLLDVLSERADIYVKQKVYPLLLNDCTAAIGHYLSFIHVFKTELIPETEHNPSAIYRDRLEKISQLRAVLHRREKAWEQLGVRLEYTQGINDADLKFMIQIYVDCGQHYCKIQNQAMAIEQYLDALACCKQWGLEDMIPYITYLKGLAYTDLRQWDKAIADLNNCTALNDPSLLIKKYFALCIAYQILKNYPAAINALSELIKLSPNYSKAFYRRARMYYELNYYEQALEDYTQALRLNPQYTDAWHHRALLYQKHQQHQEAFDDLSQAIRLDSCGFSLFLVRIEVSFALGLHQQTIKDYQRAMQLGVQELREELALCVGRAYLMLGNSRAALLVFRYHTLLDPQEIHELLKEPHEEALPAVEQVGRYSPSFFDRRLPIDSDEVRPDVDEALGSVDISLYRAKLS